MRPMVDTNKVAVFRTDASFEIGSGHVVRCLSLADGLLRQGWRCIFACHPDTLQAVPILENSGHCIWKLNATAHDDPAFLISQFPTGCNLLVVDHYELGENFESACRPWAEKILVIDDLANRRHDADILLDQTLGRNEADYAGLVDEKCLILCGSSYALVRSEFRDGRLKALAKRQGAKLKQILVNLGGSDQHTLIETVQAGIDLVDERLVVDLVLNNLEPEMETIRLRAKYSHHKIILHPGFTSIVELMAKADLAIGAAGGSAWERCCLGLPSLIVIIADNQRNVASSLTEIGAAGLLGDADVVSAIDVQNAVEALMGNSSDFARMGRSAALTVDGLGVARVCLAVSPSVTKNGGIVRLRAVVEADCEQLFKWQTAPGTRRYSRNSAAPSWAEHQEWFTRRLKNTDGAFNIILCDETAVGVFRLDLVTKDFKTPNMYEISILIAPERQSTGIGSIALVQGRKMLPTANFIAHIHEQNSASRAIFCKNGYEDFKEGFLISKPEPENPPASVQ
jgi:UDP-2,4-diacetamido-2,4,6-trideoxy-beta-L-altropyranose hydrolase